jgi:hypothetical protein
VTNASFAALHALPASALRPPSTTLVPLRKARARHERNFLGSLHPLASVCGPAVPLRSGSASLDAPLRRRSTSARRPQTEAVCTTRPLAAQAHLALSRWRLDIGFPLLCIIDPAPSRRDQRALRFADRAIGRFPVALPTKPGPLHSARVRHERDSFLSPQTRRLPSAARQRRCAPLHFLRSPTHRPKARQVPHGPVFSRRVIRPRED